MVVGMRRFSSYVLQREYYMLHITRFVLARVVWFVEDMHHLLIYSSLISPSHATLTVDLESDHCIIQSSPPVSNAAHIPTLGPLPAPLTAIPVLGSVQGCFGVEI